MFHRYIRLPGLGELVVEGYPGPRYLDRGTGPRRGEWEAGGFGLRVIWSPDRVQRRLDRQRRDRMAVAERLADARAAERQAQQQQQRQPAEAA